MLYEKNLEKSLSLSLFKNPTSEYRGTPFWAWNCELSNELLNDQIETFKSMGFGGFHMHPRTGLVTPYLGKEYKDFIKFCVEKSKSEEMLAHLYDEDRWPSGFAGGFVTKNEKYRAHLLNFTSIPYGSFEIEENDGEFGCFVSRSENGYLLCCFDVVLDENNCLAGYKKIKENDEARGKKWYAYIETQSPNPCFNNQTYVDTLQKEAMDKFIEITYDAYKNAVGDEFGKIIPSIFTDEPQFAGKKVLHSPTSNGDVVMPWTEDLNDTFMKEYNKNLVDCLPELVWELPEGKVSEIRYHYHDHVTERFTQAFADNCGKWCDENSIMLTGHMMAEESLRSQTVCIGEAMRSYRSFGLPGIDILCDEFEFSTAKQAQSASRQYGRPGVLSELYGVTGWQFDFRGHKIQGDWQAALGVTTRVPHLSWMSMAGEAKRDYPASISYQAPWHKEYPLIEDHFSRLNTALTRGKAVVRVGVIHPIESYWLHWGPESQTKDIRDQINDNFQNITHWLLLGGIDFDYICESLLPEQCEKASAPLKVGEMEYDTVIVPSCETLRSTTFDRLVDFKNSGGRIIFMGEAPKYIDAKESELPKLLMLECENIPFERYSALKALEDTRDVEMRLDTGQLTDNLVYQLRQDNECRWLFIAHGKKPTKLDNSVKQNVAITLMGKWDVEIYDTLCGKTSNVDYRINGEKTIIEKSFYNHDSVLFRLSPCSDKMNVPKATNSAEENYKAQTTPPVVPITLEEPNVLMLDYAQFALDNEPYAPLEEILRADNILRERLGYPKRQGAVAQPWTQKKEKIEHSLRLKFEFKSDVDVDNVVLAVEDAEKTNIVFNGKQIKNDVIGYYVDNSIKKVSLGSIINGKNVLELTAPYHTGANPEWCYILGDFGVRLMGAEKTVVEPVREIGFGDITSQGLPFYGGNIVYHIPINTDGFNKMKVNVSHYRGSLVGVYADDGTLGKIAFAPYEITANVPKTNTVDVKLFGNRANTFGPIHWCVDGDKWIGPNSWRSQGDGWTDSYRLYQVGILSAPIVSFY